MYGFQREMAKLRVDDRLREAERERLAARAVRRSDRGTARRPVSEARTARPRLNWILRLLASPEKA